MDVLLARLGWLLDFRPMSFQRALPSFRAAITRRLGFVPVAAAPAGLWNACAGFLDGKFWPTCKPFPRFINGAPAAPNNNIQRAVYNGRNKSHGVTGQGITLLNGMLFFFGPIEGRRHDAEILLRSGVINQVRNMSDALGNPFWLLGDKGYPLRVQLLHLYTRAVPGSQIYPPRYIFKLL